MKVLLDADILIDLDKGVASARSWLQTVTIAPSISGFASMEVAFGAENSADLRRIQVLLAPFKVLWPSTVSLQMALEHFPRQRLSHNLGLVDALIAATAIEHEIPLATFNGRHFSAIKGLTIVEPYSR